MSIKRRASVRWGAIVVATAGTAAVLFAGCTRAETDVVLAQSSGVNLVAGSLSGSTNEAGGISAHATGIYLDPPDGCTITDVDLRIFVDRNGDGEYQPGETSFLHYEEHDNTMPGSLTVGQVSISTSTYDPPPTIKFNAHIRCGSDGETGKDIRVTKPWVEHDDSLVPGSLPGTTEEPATDEVQP